MRPRRIFQLATGLAAVCLAVTGCMKLHTQIGKHLDGVVVDGTTGTPVSGAQVMYKRQPATTVRTDPKGKFTLDRQWVTLRVSIFPWDTFGYYAYPLTAQADGYALALYQPTNFMRDPESVRIELSPARK